ncbi:molybdate ABC transporter permease subunit [Aliidiomarina sp.]|uniref:molybdate ABC transporter permease subunit n=1 Tax=Aliidiomarina sp. TaxID=1872439 RepID=UPI003A4E2BF1
MSPSDWQAIALTLKLAVISTLVLLVLAIPLAWWLSQTRSRARPLLEAIVALPLVLPPTVLGFYLLIALGPAGVIGGSLEAIGFSHLAFSFTGLVIGSVIYSLPFAVQPLQNAFSQIPRSLLDAAACMRAKPSDRFLHVVMPLAKRGFITAAVLAFAHTIGEFGVVLMIGGNIPGETQVVAIAIYDHVEGLNYGAANQLSLLLLVFSLLVLLAVYSLNRDGSALFTRQKQELPK